MPALFSSLSLRHGYLLGFLSCVGLMAAAYSFEYFLFLDPCPLCMVQRLATVLVGLGFLVAFFLHPKAGSQPSWALRIALLFTLAAAIFGIWAADHHIWIQSLPPEDVPACGPSFEHLMQTLPLTELFTLMLKGNGNCAEVDWMFMGLSMPEWVRIWFVGFAAAVVFALVKTRPQPQSV